MRPEVQVLYRPPSDISKAMSGTRRVERISESRRHEIVAESDGDRLRLRHHP
jgi:hypothetical protein